MSMPIDAFFFLLLAQASPPASPGAAASLTPAGPVVALETNLGTIEVALYRDKAPLTTANFVKYVRSGHYDGTIFHRVMPGFMVQGGGYDARLEERPTGAPIKNEAPRNRLRNARGTIAMARLGAPDTATAQFFINLKDNHALDFGVARDGWGYAVFGEVVAGMDVVDRIAAQPTGPKGVHENVPLTPVVIKRARELPATPAPKP